MGRCSREGNCKTQVLWRRESEGLNWVGETWKIHRGPLALLVLPHWSALQASNERGQEGSKEERGTAPSDTMKWCHRDYSLLKAIIFSIHFQQLPCVVTLLFHFLFQAISAELKIFLPQTPECWNVLLNLTWAMSLSFSSIFQ